MRNSTTALLGSLVAVLVIVLVVANPSSSFSKTVEGAQPTWRTSGNNLSSGDFLGSTNGEPVIFKTDGAEAMRIDTNGNIGIGTTSPRPEPNNALQRLDVSGSGDAVGLAVGPTSNDVGYLSIYGGTPDTFWYLSKRNSAQNDRFGPWARDQ